MSKPNLIGISGLMHSGKDSTWECIKLVHPTAQRAAFADKLKTMAAMALGFEEDAQGCVALMNEAKEEWDFKIHFNNGPCEQFKGFTGRQYLQWLGGNARKVFGDTFWIDQVLPPVPEYRGDIAGQSEVWFWKTHYHETDLVVVTDVRYPNEAQRVRELGGQVWEIIRPGLNSDGHSSEIPLPRELVDLVIDNDGTLEDLSAKVVDACLLHSD